MSAFGIYSDTRIIDRKLSQDLSDHDILSLSETSASLPGYSLTLLKSENEWNCPALRRDWEELVNNSNHIDAILQSPQWFDHEISMGQPGDQFSLIVVRDACSHTVGVMSLHYHKSSLWLPLAGRVLGLTDINTVDILGGEPLLPIDANLYDKILELIQEWLPSWDCIGLTPVFAGSTFDNFLVTIDKAKYLLYRIDNMRPYYTLTLAETYEDFMLRFKAKKRYNLTRQIKVLRESVNPSVDMQIITSGNDARRILPDLLKRVSAQSKHHKRDLDPSHLYNSIERLSSLADRNMLLCYTLTSGGRHLATIIGFKYKRTFTISLSSYDRNYKCYSPGTVLCCMAVEDLINNHGIELVNYGFGYPAYSFCDVHDCAHVLIFKKNIRNIIRYHSHSLFRSSVRYLRPWLCRMNMA